MFLSNRLLAALLAATVAATAAAQDGPSRLDLDAAEHYVRDFEQRARSYDGQPFDAARTGSRAMEHVRPLYEKYPDHPRVKELYERVVACVRLSRGNTIEVTPDLLAYRKAEEDLGRPVALAADRGFADLIAGFEQDADRYLARAFPAPDPEDRAASKATLHKRVAIEGVRYPEHLFHESGTPYVFVGEPSRGYYYLRTGGRAWNAAFEALRRFQREVRSELPEEWTVVGSIVESTVAVPRTGAKQDYESAHMGWVVEPQAIYIAGVVLALGDGPAGTFVGEDDLAERKRRRLTVESVPDDVEPLDLVRIFATAIKEKNYALFLEAIAPEEQETRQQHDWLRFKWDLLQRGFAREYVHVDPFEAGEIAVVAGDQRSEKSRTMTDFFTPEEDREEEAARDEALGVDPRLVEQMVVLVRKFDERGKQLGAPVPVTLRRYAKGRWYIYRGFPW